MTTLETIKLINEWAAIQRKQAVCVHYFINDTCAYCGIEGEF